MQRNKKLLYSVKIKEPLLILNFILIIKNDLAAMMRDMIKSSLTDLGVSPSPPFQRSPQRNPLRILRNPPRG